MRRPRPEAPDTLRLQEAFLEDLTGRRPRSAAERAVVFRRPRRGTVEDRWHVYAHGYLARITEAAGLEYAAIRRILGEEAFASLLERYLAVFPPRSFDLSRVGDRLAAFLEFDRLSVDLPFLPELARLERAISEAFVARDAEPVAWGDLVGLGAGAVAGLRFALTPGIALIRSEWPLHEIWTCRLEEEDDAVSIALDGRPSNVLVYRQDARVRVAGISDGEAALVEAAGIGEASLEDLEALSGYRGAAMPDQLVRDFRALVEREVFVITQSTGWTGALEFPKEEIS
jgi:hypothetical protein